MRKPETLERLYLDFDGFFASVMQQACPALRGKPVGVVPFELKGNAINSSTVIACSKEAKARGVSNVMRVPDALKLCPDLQLVTQRPDLFRRAHNALLAEISCVIPIETIKSIDELCCVLDPHDARYPETLAQNIKHRIKDNIGSYITCSIGFAANRLLAKQAFKIDKPNGVTIWRPQDMPAPLYKVQLSDISGIGSRLEARLNHAGIHTMQELLCTQPKQLRQLWGNVNGERMWYALHGYEIYATPTSRGMFGHGRVLPPKHRSIASARSYSRLLLTKAARRMRRDKYYAGKLWLWLNIKDGNWFGEQGLHSANDDHACLNALGELWKRVEKECRPNSQIVRVGVTLSDIKPATNRQLDFFVNDNKERQSWEKLTGAIDFLNHKFGKRMVTIGPWVEPPGGYAGGKISYTRIPTAEDFW